MLDNLSSYHPNSRELNCAFVLFSPRPIMHCGETLAVDQEKDNSRFSTQCWHIRYNKQPFDSEGGVWVGSQWSEESRDCQSLWAAAGNTIRERASHRSLPSLLRLMFRQKDASLYNDCWQSSYLTSLCFDSAHRFQRRAVFVFSPFLWWGRSVSAVSFTLSRLPWRFPLIPVAASVRITAPRHVHRPERASCCLLYLWNSEKQAGPTALQH